jgi:hypothetical protein
MSVFDLRDDTKDLALAPPPSMENKVKKDVVAVSEVKTEDTDEQATTINKFHGSIPYYGLYKFKPNDSILGPIMRAVLPISPQVASHVSERVMDDILLQLGFHPNGENIFCGEVQGHRAIVTRMMGDDGVNNKDEYGLSCSDEEQARQFLVFLQAYEVDVQKLM